MEFFFKAIPAKYDRFIFVYILFLIFPALFLNLGLMPLILDEATRANVALEMLYSGEIMVPTINGEFYYNKPPLFNWIQLMFVKLTGSTSETVFRLPVVTSLLLFAFSIYQTQKKVSNRSVALLSALSLLTCGRILFYDSFHGLIDISFSWVIYLMFWYIFSFGRRKEYFNLFMITYLLASIGFLMKGLPALVFLGISLLAYFIYTREFKRLFTWQHLAGFILLLAVAGIYMLAYSRHNSLDIYFETLWSESSKRTFMDNSWWDSVKHIFQFPLDFIFHFLPWTVFLFLFLYKKARKHLLSDEFGRFSLLMFGANILIYWLSPAIFPRYLFMFLPLAYYTVFRILSTVENEKLVRSLLIPIINILIIAALAGMILIPFLTRRELYDYFFLKYVLVLLLAIPFIPGLFRANSVKIVFLVGILLVIRIAFNWFVFPDRIANGTELYQKNGAIVAGELTRGQPLHIYGDTRIHHASTFYIMKTRGEILRRWKEEPGNANLYIVERDSLVNFPPHTILFSFETRIEALKLSVVQTGIIQDR